MLSIAVGQLIAALANKLSSLTGGSDGLSGISPGQIFGVYAFDMYGRTGYVFSVAVLMVVFVVLLRIVHSPFGLLCQAIKDDSLRARMIGARVYPRLVLMYGVSGLLAELVALSTPSIQASWDLIASDLSGRLKLSLCSSWVARAVSGAR